MAHQDDCRTRQTARTEACPKKLPSLEQLEPRLLLSTVYVDIDATAGGDTGASWANAYTSLQSALGSADSGDEIWVAEGTYKPSTSTRTDSFEMVDGVSLYGGFDATETLLTQRDWVTNITTLSGDIGTAGIATDNSYHVVTDTTGNDGVTLDGFTITDGYADGTEVVQKFGGGILITDDSSPTLTNLIISENYSDSSGGGIYLSDSSLTLSNSVVSLNESGGGGGICAISSSIDVSGCAIDSNEAGIGGGITQMSLGYAKVVDTTFEDNSATLIGGGGGGAWFAMGSEWNTQEWDIANCDFINNSTVDGPGGAICGSMIYVSNIANCRFTGNEANGASHGDGGAIYISYLVGKTHIANSTFAGNYAEDDGGAIYDSLHWGGRNSALVVANSTLTGNSADSDGGGICVYDGIVELQNSILWDNESSTAATYELYDDDVVTQSEDPSIYCAYSDIEGSGGSTSWSTVYGDDEGGNIDDNPDFISSTNFRLQSTSPAIDAGSNSLAPSDTLDIDNDGDVDEAAPLDVFGQTRNFDDTNTTDTGSGTAPIIDMGASEFGPYILKVAADASENTGAWRFATPDLQDALALALDGDEIWVAKGTYTPSSAGTRTASFDMIEGVELYGGFAGIETSVTQRDITLNTTILSGDLDGDDAANFTNYDENSYHVVTDTTGGEDVILDGFTITGGYADGTGDNTAGGGMFIDDNSDPTLRNITFLANWADDQGGGMFAYGGSPTFTGCAFFENSAVHGGGLYASYGYPTIYGSVFEANEATSNGGGAYIYNCRPTLVNTSFGENTADNGAGLYTIANISGGVITNSSFVDNDAASSGGGMYVLADSGLTVANTILQDNAADNGAGIYNYGATLTLANNTFGGNAASASGGGIYNNTSNPAIDNTILWGNTAGTSGANVHNSSSTPVINYSDIQGCGGSGGSWVSAFGTDSGGNIDSNPLFASSTNLRLQSGSPAIDAADNSAVASDTEDLDDDSNTSEANPYDRYFQTRFVDDTSTTDTGNGTAPIVDMGACEYVAYVLKVDQTTNDNTGLWMYSIADLQDALAVALDGDEIWVAKGTHTPSADGTRTASFDMIDGVGLYGGFVGTETACSQRDADQNVTILSGDLDGDDNANFANYDENSYHVVTDTTGGEAILDGFTITGGYADSTGDDADGGGMFVDDSSDPTLRNITFLANWADDQGGGLYVNGGVLTVVYGELWGNTATDGGGMYTTGLSSGSLITNTMFDGNSATNGGALHNYSVSSGNLTIVNTLVVNNTADDGAGIYNDTAAPAIINATIAANSADSYGGGIYNDDSSPDIANSILWDNEAGTSGDTVYNTGTSSPDFSYSDVEGSGGSGGSWVSALGTDDGNNIDSDPLFVSATSLRPMGGSPVIDAGNNSAVPADSQDLDGDSNTSEATPLDYRNIKRFYDDSLTTNTGAGTNPVDMGVYELVPLFVDGNSGDNWYSQTWDVSGVNFYTGLLDALADAVSGDQVWVAKGTYYPTSGSDRTVSFELQDGVRIYGGFLGGEFSISYQDAEANETILSGDLSDNDGANFANYSDNSYHVVTGIDISSDTVLSGFIIEAGNANGNETQAHGGGMYLSDASPTLEDVTFRINTAISGAGMYNDNGSDPTLTRVVFNGNKSEEFGGGLYNYLSDPNLSHCILVENYAAYNGGGMYNRYADPVVVDSIFSDNVAKVAGGGMYNTQSSPIVVNTKFDTNEADDGAGMFNRSSSNPHISNSIFVNNDANERGGGIFNGDDSDALISNTTIGGNEADIGGGVYNFYSNPTINNSIIYDNSAVTSADNIHNEYSAPTVSYSDVEGSGGSASWDKAFGVDGGGNIDSDPLFEDQTNGDLRVEDSSPTIDAGSNSLIADDLADLDGDENTSEDTPQDILAFSRQMNDVTVSDTGSGTAPIVSMGAYEVAITGDFDSDNDIDDVDIDDLTGQTSYSTTYDLDGDGTLDSDDLDVMILANCLTAFGDLDLDGDVDTTDYNTLVSNMNSPGGWADGDLNGDGNIDLTDFGIIKENLGYDRALPTAASTFTWSALSTNVSANMADAQYVIITRSHVDDIYENAIEDLAEWKQLKGYRTYTLATSSSSSTIYDYIFDAYHVGSQVEYVLFGTDTSLMAAGSYNGSYATFYTDHIYACVSGDDANADIAIGRLPGNTVAEIETMVDKLVGGGSFDGYDRTADSGSWYDEALIAGQFQDSNNDEIADRWFAETTHHIADFLGEDYDWYSGTSPSQGYNTEIVLGADNFDPSETYTYRATDYPTRATPPATVPSAWEAEWHNNSDSTERATATATISSTINSGVGLVIHRDHGNTDGWSTPSFDTSDVSNLTNGDALPVVFSFNCLTGDSSGGAECFAEEFITHSSGGAVGILAAASVSFSGPNDVLAKAIIDGFWDDMETWDSEVYDNSWRPAETAMRAKARTLEAYEGDSNECYATDTAYMYNWFGDPEMMLRTETPETMTVTHSSTVTQNSYTDLTITVEDSGSTAIEGARVCISKSGGDDYYVGVTNSSGQVIFSNFKATSTGTYDVVATAHDTSAYEGTITCS